MRTGVVAIAWIGCVLHGAMHQAAGGPLRHKPSTPDYPSDARSHGDCADQLKKYLELAPKAADRAEVEKIIAELEHRVPDVFVGARDFASSQPGLVVLLDGQVIGDIVTKPGQIRDGKLDLSYGRGRHWVAVVTPIPKAPT